MPVQPGQVLAERYEILAHLGTGGMGAVYQARDRLAGETIAIKFVLPSISREPRLREKFKREVLVARKLTHPNVVRIYDIGEHHGMLFISMELIAGRTVEEILSQKKQFTVEEFLELFHQFTSALAYIHSQNVLHRDIKPQNLMYDKNGILKVMVKTLTSLNDELKFLRKWQEQVLSDDGLKVLTLNKLRNDIRASVVNI